MKTRYPIGYEPLTPGCRSLLLLGVIPPLLLGVARRALARGRARTPAAPWVGCRRLKHGGKGDRRRREFLDCAQAHYPINLRASVSQTPPCLAPQAKAPRPQLENSLTRKLENSYRGGQTPVQGRSNPRTEEVEPPYRGDRLCLRQL